MSSNKYSNEDELMSSNKYSNEDELMIIIETEISCQIMPLYISVRGVFSNIPKEELINIVTNHKLGDINTSEQDVCNIILANDLCSTDTGYTGYTNTNTNSNTINYTTNTPVNNNITIKLYDLCNFIPKPFLSYHLLNEIVKHKGSLVKIYINKKHIYTGVLISCVNDSIIFTIAEISG